MIRYQTGNQLDLDQVIELYRASTLGERRPVDDRDRMGQMLANANLVITAWDDTALNEAALVGIARSVTDFCYTTYLADLAVQVAYQRRGIGRELIRRTQDACTPQTRLVLLSAPKAVTYYPRVGFTRHEQCWQLEPGKRCL
jgi:predicted N-acetyltransferase YhbS